jgi:hypothetical protein
MKSFDLKSALLRALLACALVQALPAAAADATVAIISPGLGTLGWWMLLFG